uniref:ATP synthase complex subunit 8 n=1 Tax=Pelodiscus sinensis TaxID=13735 RepID=Q6B3D3_PELSI|nr:ATPase subunit 8 [Pelodiscus sinensis]QEO19003.1 ATP synthase F0 subunit 8 [Pelodiscus sinensis]WFF64262.1 ATP synthase F0 subunit 8 [Pelodiscus sinensis]WFF64275.1 ATP synthase F0 subunit 8 [Pelodiscus sinensis]WFF64288.1 ATP synthase F0 subunit 8 [Pelodiscus sinensis]|eukprot:YP_063364.1 ATP synthase F0 subunit 8 (mitochondrion) [Pelodiscus sinensis]
MPQLNPNPWLSILLTTWLVYIMIYQPKIISLLQTNNINHNLKPLNINSWNWPWT